MNLERSTHSSRMVPFIFKHRDVSMNKRLEMHEAVRDWIISTLLNLVMPLLPLTVEHFARDTVSDLSWVLAASMYALSTGIVSRYVVIFIISMLFSLFYTAMFGVLLVREDVGSLNAPTLIAVIFLINVSVKFWYHVVERQPFTEFSFKGE